jgi:quercetin dioxygenase-like cupin family protein
MSSARPTIRLGAFEVRFLVEAEDSGGSATVFECRFGADAKLPLPHSHDGFEETIYGLEGVTTFTVDGEAHEIGPGDCVCIKRGQVHGFENGGDGDAAFLAIASPGVFGPAYFEEIAAVVAEAQGGPPDVSKLAEVMGRHGLTPAPVPSSA